MRFNFATYSFRIFFMCGGPRKSSCNLFRFFTVHEVGLEKLLTAAKARAKPFSFSIGVSGIDFRSPIESTYFDRSFGRSFDTLFRKKRFQFLWLIEIGFFIFRLGGVLTIGACSIAIIEWMRFWGARRFENVFQTHFEAAIELRNDFFFVGLLSLPLKM